MRAGAFDLGVNRARDNVPRRKRPPRIVTFHKIFTAIVAEDAALTSNGFRNQERFRLGIKQTRRMKLNKLHVRDRHTSAPRHRHAVAGRDVGIGCVEIDFSAAAGREHDPIRSDRLHLVAVLVEDVNAEATIFSRVTDLGRRNQVDRHVIFQKIDMRLPSQFAQQCVLDLFSGHILHVQDAPLRMPTFAAQIEFTVAGDSALIELHAKIDKFLNPCWRFRNNCADGVFVA